MAKRGDNIHRRKDGRWEGRYPKERSDSGAIRYGSVYGKTYRETKEKLSAVSPNDPPAAEPKQCNACFKEVLSLWMENNRMRFKGGTIMKYQYLIDKHILPEMGEAALSSLTQARINLFLDQKLQAGRIDQNGGLFPSYVRSMMLIINSALKYASEQGMCQPLKTPLCRPPAEQKDIPVLSMEEQKTLEASLWRGLTPTKMGILLSLYTGMRIGEVCALSWDDVDMLGQFIRIRHTVARVRDPQEGNPATRLIIDSPKTKASFRDIPIPSALQPVLAEARLHSSSRYVISDTDGFLNPRTYEYRYHQILRESGIDDINYHALRHTFATRCIEAGVDVKSLSEILGHANVGITLNTYVHSSMKLKRTQLEKLSTLSSDS